MQAPTADTLHFQVRSSSSDEVYRITAHLTPPLRITCTCPAGAIGGDACKHRTALLLGDVSAVVEINADEIERLSREAATSPLGTAIRDLEALEVDADRIKRAVKAKKKQIGRLMDGR